VISDSMWPLVHLASHAYGKAVCFDEIRSLHLGVAFGLNEIELSLFLKEANSAEFLRNLSPVFGAEEVLHRWARLGIEVFIVTGRPPSTESVSISWLRDNKIEYSKLLFFNKYRSEGFDESHPSVISLATLTASEFSCIIDDSPRVLDLFLKQTKHPIIVYDRPWNVQEIWFPNIVGNRLHRCRDWGEIDGCVRTVTERI